MLQLTNLIGFGAAPPAKLTAVSLFASATGSSGSAGNTTVTVPAGVIAGDLLVFVDSADAPTPATGSVPAGFTLIRTDNVGGGAQIVSYKIAVGNEAGTNIVGSTVSTQWRSCLFVFRGNVPIKTVTAAGVNGQATASDPTAQTITSGSGTPPLVAIADYRGTTPATRTFSRAADGTISNPAPNAGITSASYKIYNSAPANISVDMTDEGLINILQSFYLALS
jgi:hypothetical protein